MGLYQVFPALAGVNIFLFNGEGFANRQQLLCSKHAAVIRDKLLWCPKLLNCGIEDNQDTREILALKDITGEDSA